MPDEGVTDQELEIAVGGSYELPDGRKFWVDRPAALEIVRRVRAALSARYVDNVLNKPKV